MSQQKPHYLSRNFIKMMASYCLVIFIGLGLISIRTTGKLEESTEAKIKEALKLLLTEMGG